MKKNNHNRVYATVLLAAILTIGVIGHIYTKTNNGTDNPQINNITITTTTEHIADLVKNIAGDHAQVISLMAPGTDPHLYKPVRSDIVKLSHADIVFYNGRHLEGQMIDLFERMAEQKPVIGLAYSINNLIKDNDGVYDPHIWMDVQNWIDAADIVSKELSVKLPEHRQDFELAAEQYKNNLVELDHYIKFSISTIPESNRVLVTAHDAFGYLGKAYGIEVIGVQGLSTASEAGLFEVESLVKRITDAKIPAIFAESSVSDQNIRAIQEGARAQGHNLQIGETLYSDSLGPSGSGADTYIGMMKHNVQNITKALGGKVIDPKQYKEANLRVAK